MPETEDESTSPEFNEFSKLLLNGQKIADETKKSYFFIWRGYKACISSQLPKLSHKELDRRFKLAMDSIKKAKEESEVATQLFKKPPEPISSSTGPPSSLSSNVSSDSISSEDPSQIPETQFDMQG